jgi:hypothetical protein
MKKINQDNVAFAIQSAIGTGSDGLHAKNSWLDKGFNLFKNGLTIELNQDNSTFKLSNDLSYTVKNDVLACMALFESIQGKGESIESILSSASQGYLSKSQLNFANRELKENKTVLTIKSDDVLTSKEYKERNENLLYKRRDDILNLIKDDTFFSTDFIDDVINNYVSHKFKENFEEVYLIKLDKEEKLAKRFEGLKELGTITHISGVVYSVLLDVTELGLIGKIQGKFSLMSTLARDNNKYLVTFKVIEEG